MSEPRILVLLSLGRHPASGRPRRADLDARALEMALAQPEAAVEALHVGEPGEPALRDYLGMGLARLTVLAAPPQSDALLVLQAYLAGRQPPDLILAGTRAEAGECSGLLPYRLAEALGLPLVAGAAAIEQEADRVKVIQARPRGARRRMRLTLPALVTVGPAGDPARQVSFARARRGDIQVEPVEVSDEESSRDWTWQPARPRPKRMKSIQGAGAAARLAAASGTANQGGRLLEGLSADQAAEAVYQALLEDDLLPKGG